MVGSFENNVGHFFAKDTFNGKPIIMMFRWDARDKEHPVWSQAFSPDNGKTWEWNGIMCQRKLGKPESLRGVLDWRDCQWRLRVSVVSYDLFEISRRDTRTSGVV